MLCFQITSLPDYKLVPCSCLGEGAPCQSAAGTKSHRACGQNSREEEKTRNQLDQLFPSSPRVVPNLNLPVCDTSHQTPQAAGSLGPPSSHPCLASFLCPHKTTASLLPLVEGRPGLWDADAGQGLRWCEGEAGRSRLSSKALCCQGGCTHSCGNEI